MSKGLEINRAELAKMTGVSMLSFGSQTPVCVSWRRRPWSPDPADGLQLRREGAPLSRMFGRMRNPHSPPNHPAIGFPERGGVTRSSAN